MWRPRPPLGAGSPPVSALWMRWARRGREDASAGAAREVVGALRPQRILNRMTRARSPGAAIFDTRSGSRAEKESVAFFSFFMGGAWRRSRLAQDS